MNPNGPGGSGSDPNGLGGSGSNPNGPGADGTNPNGSGADGSGPGGDAQPSQDPGGAAGTSAKCRVNAKLVPSCGALWGVYVRNGWVDSSLTGLEAKVGRRFAVFMRYVDWRAQFPDASARRLGQTRHLFVSWDTRDYKSGEVIRWRDVANGAHDGVVRAAAQRMKSFGRPVFLSFDHEMELHIGQRRNSGTAADYVAAARRVHGIFTSVGARNVVWVFTLSGGLWGDQAAKMRALYPGDAYVDWVGWDPYNFYRCHNSPWESFAQSIDTSYRWFAQGIARNKPLILPEYGTAWDPSNPSRAARWHDSIPSVLKTRYPKIKALIRWDSDVVNNGIRCHLPIDSGPGMLPSFRKAGLDPYLSAR
ncbi:hypothetical protein LO762_01205 [Actinocorallia sp. API 0066]|uniref:glycoside hydrolase family 26 protein n=1 Tax=Actinocorallia sp. API 0066 TaxID=2896846 RepID=UPI001E480FFB|nr:hypothetical protein [Actinocorallia sp. API 0066]MCD0447818.1 hypothetical protein [Actinocorallia sp. API 0066]